MSASPRRRSSIVSGYNYPDDHSLAASTIRTYPSGYLPTIAQAAQEDNAYAAPCDLAKMEVPSSPSNITHGTIDTTPSIAEDDVYMEDVMIEMPQSMHRENECAAGRSGTSNEVDHHPTGVGGVIAEDRQSFVPATSSVANSRRTKLAAPTGASSVHAAPSKCSSGEHSHRPPSLNGEETSPSLKPSATQPTVSTGSSATSFDRSRRSASVGTKLSKRTHSSVSTQSRTMSVLNELNDSIQDLRHVIAHNNKNGFAPPPQSQSGSSGTPLVGNAARGAKTSEANGSDRSARSRATTATRVTARSAGTTQTVKSFRSLPVRGGRNAPRTAKLANMRPNTSHMPIPMPSPTPEMTSPFPYKAAKDDMTLKTVDGGDGATLGTSFTRRSAKTAVTTVTARSFYSLSGRPGRKAITSARLATRAAIASPLAFPATHTRDQSKGKSENNDNATASTFDEYFSMEGGTLGEEGTSSPKGCLIICSADNELCNPNWRKNKVVDTEDVLDEGAWDDYEWHELPSHVRDAACLLGCTSSQAWNCGGVAYSIDKSWNELSPSQIKAAGVLGFNQKLWDHETVERTKFQQAIRGFDTCREVVRCDREAGEISSIAIPATWENMLSLCTEAVQVALIAQYLGPDVLAAYAVVEGCLLIAYNIGSGLEGAEEVLICQALGMKNSFLAGQWTLLAIAIYVLLAAPVYIALIFFIDEIIIGLGLGVEVAEVAMLYIPVLTLSHLVYDTVANTISSLLRCSGKYVEMTIIDSIFEVLHMLVIAIGIAKLEFDLVGIAWVEVGSSVGYGIFIYAFAAAKGWLQPFWGGLTDLRVLFSWTSIKKMTALTFPLTVNEFLSSAEWSVLSLFAAWMGVVDLNAWTILGSLWAIFEYAPEGIHTAVVMRLGFHLGHGDPKSAKITGYKCLASSGVLSLLVSVCFYAWHEEIIAIFTDDAFTATILEKNSLLIAIGNIIVSLGGTASVVLTAQGRPGIATWIYSIGMWGIGVPLCAWFTFDLGYNTTGLVCAMLIAYTTSSLILLATVFTTNWAKASMEAIAAEAEEEEHYGGEDDGTVSTTKRANLIHYGSDYGDESTQGVDTSMVQDGAASSVKHSVAGAAPSVSPSITGASPLDVPMACSDDADDRGMETIMSPSGRFTIIENRDARFRQWVGFKPTKNGKSGNRKPPRAPKKKVRASAGDLSTASGRSGTTCPLSTSSSSSTAGVAVAGCEVLGTTSVVDSFSRSM